MKKLFFLMAAFGMLGMASCSDDKKNPDDPNSGQQQKPNLTVTAIDAECTPYNSVAADGSSNLRISLGSMDLNPENIDDVKAGHILNLSLYGIPAQDGPIIPALIYQIGAQAGDGICLLAESSYIEIIDKQHTTDPIFLKSGKVTVSVEGETYTIKADVVLDETDKRRMVFNYTGKMRFKKGSYSSLQNDIEVDVEGIKGEFIFFGDPYKEEADTWGCFIQDPAQKDSDAVQFSVLCPKDPDALKNGPKEGRYPIDLESGYKPGKLEMLPGVMNKGTLYETWYLHFNAESMVTAMAPATDGWVEISKSEGGEFTCTFELKDDNDPAYTMKGSWTGVPKITSKAE